MTRITFAILTALFLGNGGVNAQTTAFNYTGYLLDSGVPANGSNDLQFTIYATNTSGTPLTGSVIMTNQPVNNGIFVVALDFGGSAFNGADRWLEIATRPGGSAGIFTNTFPRQPITAAPYAVYANNGVPPGSVMAYMGTNPPAGWLLCDGSVVNRANYAALYAVVGNTSGAGNGTTTFNLPDMRGMFLRGVDGTAGRAPDSATRTSQASGGNAGNNVGSAEGDGVVGHTHSSGGLRVAMSYVSGGVHYRQSAGGFTGLAAYGVNSTGGSGPRTDSVETFGNSGNPVSTDSSPAGYRETRPKNVFVNYIIKY